MSTGEMRQNESSICKEPINIESLAAVETWLSKGTEFASAEEAYACFEKANKIIPTVIGHFGLGKAIGKKSRDPAIHEQAIVHFNDALEMLEITTQDGKEELMADIEIQKAFSCSIAGRFDESLESINRALSTYRTLEDKERIGHALCHDGIRLYLKGEKEAALAKFNEAMRENPKDGDTWYNKAIVYRELGKPADANYCLLKAKGYGTSVDVW